MNRSRTENRKPKAKAQAKKTKKKVPIEIKRTTKQTPEERSEKVQEQQMQLRKRKVAAMFSTDSEHESSDSESEMRQDAEISETEEVSQIKGKVVSSTPYKHPSSQSQIRSSGLSSAMPNIEEFVTGIEQTVRREKDIEDVSDIQSEETLENESSLSSIDPSNESVQSSPAKSVNEMLSNVKLIDIPSPLTSPASSYHSVNVLSPPPPKEFTNSPKPPTTMFTPATTTNMFMDILDKFEAKIQEKNSQSAEEKSEVDELLNNSLPTDTDYESVMSVSPKRRKTSYNCLSPSSIISTDLLLGQDCLISDDESSDDLAENLSSVSSWNSGNHSRKDSPENPFAAMMSAIRTKTFK